MKSIQKTLLGIAMVALAGSLPAMAQVFVINDNLDAKSGGTAGYTFGDAANATRTYTAGAGVGGSVGAVIMSDFLPPGVGYGGEAFQYQVNGTGGINTSANLSDYTLSFDALVNKANGGFGLTVQSWANAGFGGTFTSSGSASDITLATPNVFQHYDINLGTLNPGVDMTGQTLQIAWQMDEYTYGGPGTGDEMIIDNVQLTMATPAPEPSTLALCAMGAVSGFAFLRRRKS